VTPKDDVKKMEKTAVNTILHDVLISVRWNEAHPRRIRETDRMRHGLSGIFSERPALHLEYETFNTMTGGVHAALAAPSRSLASISLPAFPPAECLDEKRILPAPDECRTSILAIAQGRD
jgi:hypothetical protein